MPTEPEVTGLLALIKLHRARADARFDHDGELVLLQHQDRSRWDHDVIAEATQLLTPGRPTTPTRPLPTPGRHRRLPRRSHSTGPTLTGNRSCCSTTCSSTSPRPPSPACTAPSPCATPPAPRPPSPSSTPSASTLDGYHLFHATRAELLRALGHADQARSADQRALELTANPAEQALLQRRLSWR